MDQMFDSTVFPIILSVVVILSLVGGGMFLVASRVERQRKQAKQQLALRARK